MYIVLLIALSARAFTTGSSTGTIVVVAPNNNSFVDASMTCQLEEEQLTVSVIWLVHSRQNLTYQATDEHNQFVLTQNGQLLEINNTHLPEFLSSVFECRLLTSPSFDSSIHIANFTTVEISGDIYNVIYNIICIIIIIYFQRNMSVLTLCFIPDPIVISTELYIRHNGSVSGGYYNNTIISASALSSRDVILPCYGASGYGDVKWRSTLPYMLGYLDQDSFSPYYSAVYNGSVSILTLYRHGDQSMMSGSLTCYSEEAGLFNNNSVTIHITNGQFCSSNWSNVLSHQ